MTRIDKLDDLLAKLKPVLGEKRARTLWMLYHFDSRQKEFIESIAYLMSARHLDETFEKRDILLPPVPEDKAGGEYPLGMVWYGSDPKYPFALREEEWIHHVAILGRSGSGKTMVAFLVLLNLLRQDKPFLVFDWKRNYRDMLTIDNDILVFTVGRGPSFFCWNPLIPPEGIQPTAWIKKLIEIISHAWFVGEGVCYLLLKAIDAVFREKGVYSNSGKYPTFHDVFRWIKEYRARGREAQWLDSTKRTLQALTFGDFGNVFNGKNSIPLDRLLNRNVVMELDALTKSEKTFFTEALLLWIHHYRLGQKDRERFKHAILIEEAHHILLRKKQELRGEEAITDIILREIRELGESIVLIDQHPSLISKPALGNTYTTIAMNLKHISDVATISDSILLKPDQRDYLGELPTGSAIVKLQGRWFRPFLVKFPYFPLKKGIVADQDVKEKMKGYYTRIGLENPEDGFPEDVREIRPSDNKTKSSVSLLEKGSKALLEDAVGHPVSGMVERYRRLGLNSYQGNKIKKHLIEQGLVKETSINTKKGRIKVLKPTAKGYRLIDITDSGLQTGRGNPGPRHEFWKKRIADYYRKLDCRVEEEKSIGKGKSVDLVINRDGKSIAVEIETGKSDAVYNIQKDLDAGFDRVYSVSLDPETKFKIGQNLKNSPVWNNPKIRLMDTSDFI